MLAPDTLARLTELARSRCSDVEPAHDFLHVSRVVANAERVAREAGADVTVCHLSALLHELVNLPKSHPDSPRSGELCAIDARAALTAEGVDDATVEAVAYAIAVHPFSLGVTPTTLEAKVLQDADRLDAIGAVGIARCFASCASMGRPFYHPDDPLCGAREPDDKRWGVDHFYKKLLKIEAGMHTDAGRAMARERTAFMREFLARFDEEIRGGPV